jgi:hypothetical protein
MKHFLKKFYFAFQQNPVYIPSLIPTLLNDFFLTPSFTGNTWQGLIHIMILETPNSRSYG